MKTCVSINCPFIFACKKYNNNVDRENGCGTQREFVKRAEKLKAAMDIAEWLGVQPRELSCRTIWKLWQKDGELEPFTVLSTEWDGGNFVTITGESQYTGYMHKFRVTKRTLGEKFFLSEVDAVEAQKKRKAKVSQ